MEQLNVKFEIVNVYPDVRGVNVKYFTDQWPEGYVVHVTIYPDPMPTGEDLKNYILSYANLPYLKLKSQGNHDMSAISSLANTVVVGPDINQILNSNNTVIVR